MTEDDFDQDLLHEAAAQGDLDLVMQLSEGGADINAFDSNLSYTPLHHAVVNGHTEVVAYLLQRGADVNAHDDATIGDTPLRATAANCTFEMAKILIDAGADPAIPGWMGITALHQAGKRTKPEGRRVYQLLARASQGSLGRQP